MTQTAPPPAGLTPVTRYSTVGAVAKRLLQYLTSSNFPPGTRLPAERTVSAALGVGRSTLREAMAALDVLGIIEVRPGSGAYLVADSSGLTPQALKWSLMLGQPRTHDLVEVRESLEILAAKLAAERADDAGIATLSDHVQAMRAAGADVDTFVRADINFHFCIAELATNVALQDILHSIHSLLTVWFDRTLRVPGTLEATLVEHEAVFEAIRSRSADRADSQMRKLMDAADRRLRATLDGQA